MLLMCGSELLAAFARTIKGGEMKIKKTLIAFVLAVALLGCGKREPRHIIVMPDVSGSIDRQALKQTFKAIDELVGHLQRGDRIAIIPILGDAQAEASGRIIRFEVPKERQAYDADLRDFRLKLETSLEEMESTAVSTPGSKTDILGSVILAQQEFHSYPARTHRMLAILSDFIQEDKTTDFKGDERLANLLTAMAFASRVAERDGIGFEGIQVYLGRLRSHEYACLTERRREAIQAFWTQYFMISKAVAVSKIVGDGPGLLRQQFL